jgi:hypothetical protein
MAIRAKKTLIRKTPAKAPKGPRKVGMAAISTNLLVKDLRPKDADLTHYGTEPNFSEGQPESEKRNLAVNLAYNWYSHFYGPKEAKDFLAQYLDAKDPAKAKIVRRAPDNQVIPTYGFTARMASRGLELNEREIANITKQVDKLVNAVSAEAKAAKKAEAELSKKVQRPSIQEIMREKADEAGSEIEAIWDEYLDANKPKDFSVTRRIINELQSRNVLPQHIAPMIRRWERLRDEYLEVQAGKCPQLNEAYSDYTKMQVRNAIKLVEEIIAEFNGYISLKQAVKKVRVKKPVPVEKVVSKLKFCRSFTDTVLKLELVGLHPVKLHNATEAFVYDTQKRKLIWLVADDYSKCLFVKGNTVLGFDTKKSMSKTIRKPGEFLAAFNKASRPAIRKMVGDIKSVVAVPNGRFNDKMIILKVW